MESKRKVLQKLFLSTLYLSAFTFGGGYVIVTLMKKKFVDEYHWIEENEMLDLVAIAQSSPGPIAVNGAIVVGYKLAGMIGVLVSIIGTIIPLPFSPYLFHPPCSQDPGPSFSRRRPEAYSRCWRCRPYCASAPWNPGNR